MLKSGNFRLCVSLPLGVRGPLSYEFGILISLVAQGTKPNIHIPHTCCLFVC